jgi:hypothetical protein
MIGMMRKGLINNDRITVLLSRERSMNIILSHQNIKLRNNIKRNELDKWKDQQIRMNRILFETEKIYTFDSIDLDDPLPDK